jgi:drug/metabolite transporter (DMT)-like permease
LWAPLWGFMFFQEIPRATTVAGAAVIVLAGLLALRMARHPSNPSDPINPRSTKASETQT